MVFLTCMIIIIVLYFLLQDGLIFVIMIALVAELANLWVLKTVKESAENQTKKEFSEIIESYKAEITAQKKTIREFDDLQEELHNANLIIKKYEQDTKDKKNPEIDDIKAKKAKFKEEIKIASKSKRKNPDIRTSTIHPY